MVKWKLRVSGSGVTPTPRYTICKPDPTILAWLPQSLSANSFPINVYLFPNLQTCSQQLPKTCLKQFSQPFPKLFMTKLSKNFRNCSFQFFPTIFQTFHSKPLQKSLPGSCDRLAKASQSSDAAPPSLAAWKAGSSATITRQILVSGLKKYNQSGSPSNDQ